jgi:hypothetical protein
VKPVVALISFIFLGVWGHTNFLQPQFELMHRIRDELCGGNRDFVAGVDQAGMVWAVYEDASMCNASYYEVSEYYEPPDRGTDYSLLAFRRSIGLNRNEYTCGKDLNQHDDALATIAYEGYQGAHLSVVGACEQRVDEITDYWNQDCLNSDSDLYQTLVPQSWKAISMMLKEDLTKSMETNDVPSVVPDIASCAHVKDYCWFDLSGSVRARQFCPQTCGCDDPASTLAMISSKKGCPPACRSKHLNASSRLSELSCEDWTPRKPRRLGEIDLLDAYYTGLKAAWGYTRDFDWWIGALITLLNHTLHERGCAGFVEFMDNGSWGNGNLCQVDNIWYLRPITSICPVSCRCKKRSALRERGLLCPKSCF